MKNHAKKTYNQRLFERNAVQKFYHTSRFNWVKSKIKKGNIKSNVVLELGCFDGRLVSYIPDTDLYVGIDANVENGLDLAKKTFLGDPNKVFFESTSPLIMDQFGTNQFGLVASLETLEHIRPSDVDDYLKGLSRILDGDIFITVPNEKGLIFLVKHLAKKLIGSRGEDYSFFEIINAAIGRLDRVERGEHKGFDYKKLILQLEEYFEIVTITGLPFRSIPPNMNLTVAIHARSKKNQSIL